MLFGNSKVVHLLEWRDPRCSGPVFLTGLIVLVAVRYISLLSVLGNLALALLTATMAFRIYRSVLAAINKTGEGNPFQGYLDSDASMVSDLIQEALNNLLDVINRTVLYLKSAFLIDDVVQSIKFAFGMYVMVVLGRHLNGLTLATLCWLLAFVVPKVYRDNQPAVDAALEPLKAKMDEFMDKLKASLPSSGGSAAKKND